MILPMLERGPGVRHDDYRRYESCLHRWVMRSDRRALDQYDAAHCPQGCDGFVAVDPRERRDAEAARRDADRP
jgi:hypothetical protein